MSGDSNMRITVYDHAKIGRLIVQWALKPETRPASIEELAEQLGNAIGDIPDNWKAVQFVQSNSEVILFRLPPTSMVEASIARMKGVDDGTASFDYALPPFYMLNWKDLGMTAEELFYSRVGDYSTALCQ